MLISPSGRLMSIRPLLRNASFSSVLTVAGSVTERKALVPRSASLPMVVSDVPRSMLVSDWQSWNAFSQSLVRVDGSSIDMSAPHFSNAFSPIETMPSGSSTPVSDEQFSKVE